MYISYRFVWKRDKEEKGAQLICLLWNWVRNFQVCVLVWVCARVRVCVSVHVLWVRNGLLRV